jgi:DNA-binding MarR family transcriptional regulator
MNANLGQYGREIFDVLMRLSREIRCCSRDEDICGEVTFHQFAILDAVAGKGELGLAELHEILSVEKSTTTRLVGPLIRKGLLKRDRDARDSRAARLSLTEEGGETHRKVWECMTGFFEGVAGNIPEAQRADVLNAVKIFAAAIRKTVIGCRCDISTPNSACCNEK